MSYPQNGYHHHSTPSYHGHYPSSGSQEVPQYVWQAPYPVVPGQNGVNVHVQPYHGPNGIPSDLPGPSTYAHQLPQTPHYGYYPPSTMPSSTGSALTAIPTPQPKVQYEPPIFQTFQDRKRAKEMALKAQAHTSDPSPSQHAASQQYTTPYGIISASAPPPRGPGPPLTTPARPPSPATRPMPPLPPAQPAHSYSSPDSARPSPSQNVVYPPAGPSRSQTLPSSSRPLPQPIHTAIPFPPTFSPSPVSSQGSTPALKPVQATIERSDTISSIKSLDRMGFGPGKRSLPKPPVGVNTSKSLDRGTPTGFGGMGEGFRRNMGRKQPSVVSEEGSEEGLAGALEDMTIRTPSPTSSSGRPPIIVAPGRPSSVIEPNTPPIIIIPDQQDPADPRAPAKFNSLPIINLPDSDGEADSAVDSTQDRASGIAITGLPMIAVSTEETGGGISISVPVIDPASTSRPLPSRIQQDGAIICSGCDHPIIGRIVNAMKQRFHPQCFTCNECGELLEHVSSYEWEGKAYCHLDYHDKFAHRCHHCKTPIVDPRFVTLDEPILGQRYYHELHFFCSECGDPFLDPSNSSAPGTEMARSNGEDDEEETNAFVIHKGHPYCERCHLRLHKPKCRACSKAIPDVAINAMGAKWHKECFVCSRCTRDFANNLFFPKDGQAFCIECYEGMV